MEESLRDYQRAQDEAITKTQLLEQTVKGLEYELEAKNHLKDDRARQIKLMEVKDVFEGWYLIRTDENNFGISHGCCLGRSKRT